MIYYFLYNKSVIRFVFNSIAIKSSYYQDDILYVDNTMYNGVPGHWSAWIVDSDGHRGQWGIIPSKYKVCYCILKESVIK